MNEEAKVTDISEVNRSRVPRILEGLARGDSMTQIAEDLGISRSHLYRIVGLRGVRELMMVEATEVKTKYLDKLEEMANSDSPTNQRAAVAEWGKLIRAAEDKSIPTITEQHNLNLTADLTQTQQLEDYKATQEQILAKTINKFPPKLKPILNKAYWNTVYEVTGKHKPEDYQQDYNAGYEYRRALREQIKQQIWTANNPNQRTSGDQEYTDNPQKWVQLQDTDEQKNWKNKLRKPY